MARAKTAYHHGDLQQALLREAERIVDKEGLSVLTLREAARRVGVSHTAPQNHFGDLTGLLSELAAIGHQRLRASLGAHAVAAGADKRARLRAMGRAYVGFCRDHPGLFTLMFQSDRLDTSRPALRDAIVASRQSLMDAMQAARPKQELGPAHAAAIWSLVHGYAVLMLDGRLKGMLAQANRSDPMALFEQVLDAVTIS